jgi:hypothetical protein
VLGPAAPPPFCAYNTIPVPPSTPRTFTTISLSLPSSPPPPLMPPRPPPLAVRRRPSIHLYSAPQPKVRMGEEPPRRPLSFPPLVVRGRARRADRAPPPEASPYPSSVLIERKVMAVWSKAP